MVGLIYVIRIFHLRKLRFIRRISSLDNHSLSYDGMCYYYTVPKEFSDMMTLQGGPKK